MTNPDSNPINFLQEICQKNFLAFPVYTELESSGQSHCPTFSFSCSFEGSRSTGLGHDKKTAKKKAGAKMVELLKEQGFFDKYNKRDDSLTKIDQLNKDVNEGTDKNETMKTRKNPISALNEYCSKKKIEQPVFVETSDGINNFIVACKFQDKKTYGSASSKKSAKTESAAKMCEELNIPSTKEPIFVAGKLYKPNFYNSYEEEPSFVEDQNCVHVHKLQEYVVKNNLKEPIYQEKNLINNLFETTCNVGHVSGKGTDLTKEEAKNVAACEVLSKLTKSFPQIENGDNKSPLQQYIDASNQSPDGASSNNRNEVRWGLKEFLVKDEDSTSDTDSKGNVIPMLESLLLDDGTNDDEVEPTSTHKEY